MNELKYKDLIAGLSLNECGCPPDNSTSIDIKTYRYVFENDTKKHNHLPNRKISPKRVLENDLEYCSVCGLSCYNTEENAITFFKNLVNSFPNIPQKIGDSLCVGDLKQNDGVMGEIDSFGHFDFYEYIAFDPHQTFTFLKRIHL